MLATFSGAFLVIFLITLLTCEQGRLIYSIRSTLSYQLNCAYTIWTMPPSLRKVLQHNANLMESWWTAIVTNQILTIHTNSARIITKIKAIKSHNVKINSSQLLFPLPHLCLTLHQWLSIVKANIIPRLEKMATSMMFKLRQGHNLLAAMIANTISGSQTPEIICSILLHFMHQHLIFWQDASINSHFYTRFITIHI